MYKIIQFQPTYLDFYEQWVVYSCFLLNNLRPVMSGKAIANIRPQTFGRVSLLCKIEQGPLESNFEMPNNCISIRHQGFYSFLLLFAAWHPVIDHIKSFQTSIVIELSRKYFGIFWEGGKPIVWNKSCIISYYFWNKRQLFLWILGATAPLGLH